MSTSMAEFPDTANCEEELTDVNCADGPPLFDYAACQGAASSVSCAMPASGPYYPTPDACLELIE